jgi:opacity protein-like surface antigen
MIAHEFDLKGRYWQPLGGRWSAYAEVGAELVHWHVEQWQYSSSYTGHFVGSNGTSYATEFGAGIGFRLSDRWMLIGGLSRTANVRGADFTAVLIGVRYAFQKAP